MFHYARLRLTAWYLLIIMLISISFSAVIFQVQTREVERFARIQQFRIERRLIQGQFPPPGIRPPSLQAPISEPELINETRDRLLTLLLLVNGGIFIISGGLGYFLAGRTLKPIKEMLDEQNRFITDASHELRTPLTSLKSSLEVNLRDQKLTLSDARSLIAGSIEDVNKLQSLSDSLLELVQYQKPQSKNDFEKLSIAEIIKETIRKLEPLAQKRNITFKNEVRDYQIKGNKSKLSDLLIILLDNAVKYSFPKSTIIISTGKNNGFVSMSVQNHGPKIEKKDIGHIFDRFYRVEGSRSKVTQGYGLGLSIAKKIVDLHKGSITVESNSRSGTIFTVKLPNKDVSKNS